MTKQLRIAVGELTDVGRRRERNQDNVTHLVPDDPDVFARRGALFVVCDGMGGHAAGEIASEIGVRTIREQYFQPSEDDALQALDRAVRSANTAIFEHAHEHLAHSGMGTTCVAAVLLGGRGYFVNIGDSRGYIVRDGKLRQVTHDHSWVAEQVRAGVLTADQARTHTHRNVITRSLGTQPEVAADLFIETIHPGDHILLCSDGLHGYVPEETIRTTVLEHEPEAGVRQLIDLANANGGPDNITAILVSVLDAPVAVDTVTLPVAKPAPKSGDVADLPTAPPDFSLRQPLNLHPVTTAPREAAMAPLSLGEARASRRGVWPMVGLRLLAVAALCLLAFGIWDLLAGPYATGRAAYARAQRDISAAQTAANAAASEDPDQALASLAAQRQQLRTDLATLQLDATGRAQLQNALNVTIAGAVQRVLTIYNDTNHITVLPQASLASYSVSCASATVAPGVLGVVGGAPGSGGEAALPQLYVVSGSGALYALALGTGSVTCGATPVIPSGVHAIVTDGDQLYALVQQTAGWTVMQLSSTAAPAVKITLPTDETAAPSTLAVLGGDVFVVYPKGNGSEILHYGGADLKKPAQTLETATAVNALRLTAAGTPYLLLADGSLASWDAAGQIHAVNVSLAAPVQTSDPHAYSAATPVPVIAPTATPAPATPTPTTAPATPTTTALPTASPAAGAIQPAATVTATASGTPAATASPAPTATPAATGTTSAAPPTLFDGPASIAADRSPSAGLFIADANSPRVIRFSVSGGALTLVRQYVYADTMAPLRGIASTPDG
ncbi:MAG TPA: Stp1/IreP family PP2C-type Ser/Thr phosphatase, partial [Ktedonobacterales bacterium]|nr:Stp1/IreP family PP2C-type Ser/Thr phosphatase [Ktedonobacterales bacterium]